MIYRDKFNYQGFYNVRAENTNVRLSFSADGNVVAMCPQQSILLSLSQI
jgi:hypothetical protein